MTKHNFSQKIKSRHNAFRFFAFVKKYRVIVAAAVMTGMIRYLIPLVLPFALKIIIDDYLSARHVEPEINLHWMMIGLCVLYVIYGIVSYLRSYFAGLAGNKIMFDLRQALYLHVQRMSLSFFDRRRIGEVVSRVIHDIASAQSLVGAAIINTLMDLAFVVVVIGVLFMTHSKLAWIALSVLPFYAIATSYLSTRIRAKSRTVSELHQKISGELHEQLAGISTIQAFAQEESEAREFYEQSKEHLDTLLSNVNLQSIALGITAFLTSFGPILVLWFGSVEVMHDRLSVGSLTAFYAYLGMLYQPIQRLTELNLVVASSLAAVDRIFEIFDTYPEIQDSPKAVAVSRIRGDIRFENIDFRYAAQEFLFKNFSVTIPAGMSVALVGPSGAGKSTFAKLLLRFYDIESGRILLDEKDIQNITLKTLRQQFAFVAQDPILFSGTIAENLRYGKPEASFSAMQKAAEMAYADEFIRKLPKGYETEIGERGVRLSGGERQRLTIARAFLKDAPVLIMDEPTSALDALSEDLIKKAILQLIQGRTALIIAHRLSTIEHVDNIIVISGGKMVEQGKHQELLNREGGLYRSYAAHQLSVSL